MDCCKWWYKKAQGLFLFMEKVLFIISFAWKGEKYETKKIKKITWTKKQ